MAIKYYLIAKDALGFDNEEAIAAHLAKQKIDISNMAVVRGVALVPKMQLSLMPPGGAPERKPRKEPPLPDEAVLAAVTTLYADGKGRSKIKAREALSTFGVDKVDGCIDWMAHTGRLSVAGKTYTAAPEVA